MIDINDPAYWRQRAAEARALAEATKDPERKRIMLDIEHATPI